VTVDWDIGEHRLTSITAYSAYDWSKITDGDFSDLDLVVARFNEDYEQYSQEIRWISPTGGKLDYVVGAYYHMWELLSNRQNTFNRPPLNGTSIRIQDQDDDLVSVFGATTWHITDALRLAGSLRYTQEKKEAFMTRELTPVAPGLGTDFGDERDEEHWDPAATVQWDVTDRTMLFATYTHGSKGGGFAGDSATVTPETFQFEDETSNSYEVGIKFEGSSVRYALTAYRSEFKNLQVSILDPTISAFSTENVGESRSQGVEAEAMWAPFAGLTLSGSLAYLDAEYTFWPNGPCLYPNDAIPTCRQDRAGTKFDTPEWTGTAQVAYERPMTASLDFLLSVQAAFQGEADRYNNPRCVQESYTKYDARIGVRGGEGRWHAILRGKNLNDEWTFGGCPPTPLRAGFYTYNTEPPRTVAMEVGFRF
jgi:iron complex outermembrane receptor protein